MSRFEYGCKIICNENDVFPAMRQLVEEEGRSIRSAAMFINKDSSGQVTPGRADQVYRRRTKSATCVAPPEDKGSGSYLSERQILKKAKEIKTKRRQKRIKQREQQRREIVQETPPLEGDQYKLVVNNFQNADITEESIDAIITDPPYGKEFLSLYKDLSEYAAKVLRPDAPCIVMVGQAWLESVLNNLSKYLKYVWTMAHITPGSSTQVFGRKIKSNWKPIIFLVNGKNECEHIKDIFTSKHKDKKFHEWGQTEEVMVHLVERFTVKNDVILDPLCGAGTTGVAAVKRERYFIGIDSDEYSIKQTAKRLKDIDAPITKDK